MYWLVQHRLRAVVIYTLAVKHYKKVIYRKEIDRFERSEADQGMPPVACMFGLDLGLDLLKVMHRVKDVVSEIAKHDQSTWPDDVYWSASLPDWLTSSMPALSQDDYLRLMSDTPREEWRTLPWQLESWVKALAEQGWKWWSAVVGGSEASIVLEIVSAPARTAAFRQILIATGATILAETY